MEKVGSAYVVAASLSQPESVPDNGSQVPFPCCPGKTLEPMWPSWRLDALASYWMHPLVLQVTEPQTVSLPTFSFVIFKIGSPVSSGLWWGSSLYRARHGGPCTAPPHTLPLGLSKRLGCKPLKIASLPGWILAKPTQIAFTTAVYKSLSVIIPAIIWLLQPVPTAPMSLSPAGRYLSAAKGKALWKTQHH